MLRIIRTNAENQDFRDLVFRLDADLAIRDGNDHAFYSQFNTMDSLNYVVVAYENKKPVGCGALKEYSPNTMEVKRMFVSEDSRGRGIAAKILSALEVWAAELLYEICILETGKKQPEAIALYKKSGYTVIPNYAQYERMDNSVCFEKRLKKVPKELMP